MGGRPAGRAALRHAQRAALETDADRVAFLAEASNALLSSLNVERCVAVSTRLAEQYLADAAVLVAPHSGDELEVTYGRGGELVTVRVAADPAEVPGLAEALQGFPPVPSR